MAKKLIISISILVVIAIAGGVWYYFNRVHPTPIEEILGNPKAYEGKEVTIEGVVTDRTAFFVVLKFYKLKDKTGEMTVVTRKSLPELRSTIALKGRIDNAFPIGDEKLLVFVEESVENQQSHVK
ncbi:MAG TPA: hypothetical protein VLZ03_16410 [Thermodesulfobacteriota bacterium]|nr:hypothetical protein [Thermodesulfobacteriota bacterium]